MYPLGELAHLQARKAGIRRRIAVSRLECMINAAEVTRPLMWIDQVVAAWQELRPLVKLATVPLGVWLMRSFSKRFRVMSSLLRWAPLIFSAVRAFTQRSAAASEEPEPAA